MRLGSTRPTVGDPRCLGAKGEVTRVPDPKLSGEAGTPFLPAGNVRGQPRRNPLPSNEDSMKRLADDPSDAFARAIAVQWQEVLQKLPLIALGLDRHGDVVFANQHFCSVTGFRSEDVIGRHWFEHFLPAVDRQQVSDAFVELMERGFHRTYENTIVDAAGRERLIRWYNVRLWTPEGRIAGTFSLGQEVPSSGGDGSGTTESGEEGTDAVVRVCAWCSRVRTGEDQWNDVTNFVTDVVGAAVTHGLCDSCFAFLAEGKDRRES